MQTSIVLLFTPGLDSFLANEVLTDRYIKDKQVNFHRVYFDLGHRYANVEISLLKHWYKDPKYFTISNILSMKDLEHESAFIPNRNLLLASLAQSIFDADIIYLNGVEDDRVSDNVSAFRNLASSVLSQSRNRGITVKTLFDGVEKSEAVKNFAEKHKSRKLEMLTKTFSCFSNMFYEEEELPYFRLKKDHGENEYVEEGKITAYGCMECSACFRKMCALTAANIFVPFFDFSIVKKYIEENPVNEILHPNRAETVKNYHKFLDWFGCD